MANTFIEDPPYIRARKPGRIDYVGFGLMALGLASLELVLDTGQKNDWFASNQIVLFSILSVVALVSFVIWELTTDEPIVNLRIFKNRNFAVGTLLIASVGIVLYGTTALLPLFLQTLLGYPAMQSGLTVSPRGFGSVVSMLVVGRLIGKVDGRFLIMFGFCVLAYSTYMLTGINLDVSSSSVTWPLVISGFAMGFIFVPLTTMTMGTLRNEQMGNAAGIYNLMRNTGGSVGIAAMTTFLARGAQQHLAAFASHLSPYDTAFQQRFKALAGVFASGGGGPSGMQKAYEAIYGLASRQAMLMSYIDNFRLMAYLCVLCIPAALLFKRVRANKGASVAAH
jgi:DHA2 family multidrug resistance protein